MHHNRKPGASEKRCPACGAPVLVVTYPSGELVEVDARQVLVVQLMEGRPPKIEETHTGHRLHRETCTGPLAE